VDGRRIGPDAGLAAGLDHGEGGLE
jgi:hypothetical protein